MIGRNVLSKGVISRLGDTINQQEQLAAYLLGELPEEDQLRLEREYFIDDAAYEQLVALEDELAYDYLEGRLSPQRRLRFETTIGATGRGRKNLEFARSLLDVLKTSRKVTAMPARYWAAGIAAALALAVLPAWLAFRVAGLTTQLEKLRGESTTWQARLERELAARSVPPPAPAPVEATFLLAPGLARSEGGPERLQLSAQADTIRFELVLPPGASSGDLVITIRAAAGGEIWSRSSAVPGHTAIATVPARLFAAGEYTIAVRRLAAGEQPPDLATYSFRLVRK
jgi:hypothetical protein